MKLPFLLPLTLLTNIPQSDFSQIRFFDPKEIQKLKNAATYLHLAHPMSHVSVLLAAYGITALYIVLGSPRFGRTLTGITVKP